MNRRCEGNRTYAAVPLSEIRQPSLILQPWLTAGDAVPSSRVTSERALQMQDGLSEIAAGSWVSTDQVMGIVGHELRNPLSAIAALARVTMAREDLPGDVRERLAQMDRAAQRSLAIIESLLDFAESQWRGVLPTRPVLSEPHEIAGRVIEELRAVNPDRVIALDVRNPEPFEMDPARIEQVLSNLIGNAIAHGSADTPVEVSIDVREAEALLAVRNRGPVIPADQIAWLFQPFTQGTAGDPTPTTRPRGLGLGLYIVREIVNAHGGTIAVDSNDDRGTTFLIRLPRRHT
jgi:sigma-B regulation protein RsbU (phosphoserine phosphatase)